MSAAPMRLEPTTFDRLPGWGSDDYRAALDAFRASSAKVIAAAASSRPAAARPSPALLARCAAALAHGSPRDGSAARDFFERHFVPHRVVHDGGGLLTGYFEPEVEGARVPGPRFRIPLYRRPPDLVTLVDETLRGAVGEALTHARRTATGLVPFPTRAEIDQGCLAGEQLEIAFIESPIDAFFMHVQGSGLIRLADGSRLRLAYDGKNGHPYSSIGRHLIETGEIAGDAMSLESLGRWLAADPERGRQAMWRNRSYVFFRELPAAEADGPLGALSIPLVAGRSLAVDAGWHAIGTPIHVSSPGLTHAEPGGWHRLMIAHDVGSAIQGPERGDIFFGSGPEAGRLAGVTRHPGAFHVLVATP